jgi:ABC-type molybdate transport system substrate-binding protein
MIVARMSAGLLFLGAVAMATGAGAAELKLLSVEAMKPALQELASAFEADSKHKVKIEYAPPDAVEKKISGEHEYDVVILDKTRMDKLGRAAIVVGGSMKSVAKQGADTVYVAATSNSTEEPVPAMGLINFLMGPKAAPVYKAKGLEPG